MRGRKPKPTHLKLVRGNPGRRKLNLKEPKPQPRIPSPPPHLDKEALAEWERVAPELYGLGLLTNLDVGVLAAYCVSHSRGAMAEQLINEMAQAEPDTNGLLIRAGNGTLIPNPLVAIANRARSDTIRYAVELGMTPSGRSRIDLNPVSLGGDPADEYFS